MRNETLCSIAGHCVAIHGPQMFLTTIVERVSTQKSSLLNQDNEGRQDVQQQE